jgi:hypothetical protein
MIILSKGLSEPRCSPQPPVIRATMANNETGPE